MREWLAPLPVACLWGAGPKTTERLRALGYETIGDVARGESTALERRFGALGERFFALARGLDPREVVGSRRAQSVGSEHTLNVDISARPQIEAHLRLSADSVAARLRRSKRLAQGVRVKLKTTDFRVISRQTVLAEPTDVAAVMLAHAKSLLDTIAESGPFRLVGLAAYDLRAADAVDAQLDLLPEAGNRERRLETAIDALVDRFGRGVVQRAGDLRRDRGVGVAANLDFLHEQERDD
jgi:DNA polymerase-4